MTRAWPAADIGLGRGRPATEERFDVNPSDLGQSVFRVVLVSGILIWSYLRSEYTFATAVLKEPYLQFALIYLLLSVSIFLWTYFFIQKVAPESPLIPVTRVFSIFTDISAVSIYMGLSGEQGVVLYPIYLTSSIGYGYRFGIRYLYLALAVSAVGLTHAVFHNDFISGSDSLVIAFYLGIFLVPLYAASLLKRHREVLERIKDVNAARSRFIANMSHELRTPLHAIISVSDLLGESFDPNLKPDRARAQKLRMISESGQHLLNLVNRILDVAAADAGSLNIAGSAPLDLKATVLSSLRICEPTAEAKGIDFHWYYDLALPERIVSSPELWQEIIINTVGNAIKYTHTGYVHVAVCRTPVSDPPLIELVVSDTGIGIPAKLLPTIFEPFTIGDDGTARSFSGTGLGLTLTKKFVEALGGTIAFDSVERVGTKCLIRVPLRACESVAPRPSARAAVQCVLVTTRTLEAVEDAAFRAARIECTTLHPHALDTARFSLAEVVLVDVAVLADADEVIARIAAEKPRKLTVAYGPDREGSSRDPRFNAALAHADTEQLRALQLLAAEFCEKRAAPGSAAAPLASGTPRYVLVADDNSTNLRSAQLALESEGHTVTLVDSGEAALSALEMGRYDLAFIDLHMPNMTGTEVANLYQYLFCEPRTPIVILTADVTAASRAAAEEAGAVAVLTKPLRAMELRKAVIEHARRDAPAERAGEEDARDAGAAGASAAADEAALIDPAVIREYLELGVGDDAVLDMAGQFEEDGARLLATLRRARTDDDADSACSALHALKGVCATVGATRLMVVAHEAHTGLHQRRMPIRALDLAQADALLRDSAQAIFACIECRED